MWRSGPQQGCRLPGPAWSHLKKEGLGPQSLSFPDSSKSSLMPSRLFWDRLPCHSTLEPSGKMRSLPGSPSWCGACQRQTSPHVGLLRILMRETHPRDSGLAQPWCLLKLPSDSTVPPGLKCTELKECIRTAVLKCESASELPGGLVKPEAAWPPAQGSVGRGQGPRICISYKILVWGPHSEKP